MQDADELAIAPTPCFAPIRVPSPRFRRESWAELQRTLDPLGEPRPLRPAKTERVDPASRPA
jgi:hypothetical protein